MQQSNEYTQPVDTFRQQLDALADYFQRVRVEQMQQRFTQPPSHFSSVTQGIRRFLSRQLLALAHWIEPPKPEMQAEAWEDTTVIEAEFRVLDH